jgi:hypothetical protein
VEETPLDGGEGVGDKGRGERGEKKGRREWWQKQELKVCDALTNAV